MTQGIEQEVGATLVAVRNGPGARLRAAREAIGLTTLEVAQQLRLTQTMVEKLEQDNYDSHLPLVFIKGYLRSYAGLVGLDPEQVLIEFAHLGIHDPDRNVPDLGQSTRLSSFSTSGMPKHRPGLLWGSLAAFAGVMLVLMWAYHDQLPTFSAPQATSATTITTPITQPSADEAELNAAIEAARTVNAKQAAAAKASTTTSTEPVAATATTSSTTSTTGTNATAATTTPSGAGAVTGNAAASTGSVAPTVKSTTPSMSSDDESDDEDEHPVKPVSVNAVKTPVAKRAAPAGTHETMLF